MRVREVLRRPADAAKLALLAIGFAAATPYYATLIRQAIQIWFFGDRLILPATLLILTGTTALTIAIAWSGPISRIAFAVTLGMGTLVFFSLRLTGGLPATFNAMSLLLDSRDAAPDVLRLYPWAIALASALGATTALGIAWPPTRRGRRLTAPLALATMVALAILAVRRDGSGLGSTAPGWAAPIYAALVFYDRATTPAVAMRPLLPAPTRPLTSDIVILVDESIGGQYLDINAPAGARSGLEAVLAEGRAANFGIAASATNFSVGSNFVIRTGGTRANHWQRTASIWTYAHRAGYRTVYLYAQDYDGLQNLMSADERAEIDDYVTLKRLSRERRDAAVARIVRDRLTDRVPELIYVNKSGAHFPAWTTYPRAAIRHYPALRESSDGYQIVDIAAPDVRRAYRNDYRNAIAWNVGHFFDILLRGGVPAGAAILYTSDHGEALGDRAPRQFGHGRVDDPAPEEGAVPMVVIPPLSQVADWRDAAAAGRGASHYRIFPSVLVLMGYDRARVMSAFGPDLRSPVADPQTFDSRFYARFGGRPAWYRVDPARLMPIWP